MPTICGEGGKMKTWQEDIQNESKLRVLPTQKEEGTIPTLGIVYFPSFPMC